jgi:mannose-6-phosphate isomerase-like protein (cupin superfamily)
MSAGSVTTLDDALRTAVDGRAPTLACPVLEQEVRRLDPGTRRADRLAGRSEVLFVFAGQGTLRVADEEHSLAPDTGVFLSDGEAVEVEAIGSEPLVYLAVSTAPAESTSERVVRFDEVDAEPAGIGRYFRMLAQCSQATQFVGLVPPGRANMHNHPYDEIACVIEGEGVLHWHEGPSIPVGRGSVIYFPRLVFHSLENTGSDALRIMGVFHPAGSPADRVEVLDY